jgi:hypothetical protein
MLLLSELDFDDPKHPDLAILHDGLVYVGRLLGNKYNVVQFKHSRTSEATAEWRALDPITAQAVLVHLTQERQERERVGANVVQLGQWRGR